MILFPIGVCNQDNHALNDPDRLPSLLPVLLGIRATQVERIVKHQLRGFES